MRNVIIVGGGLAGLISGVQLARAGVPAIVIEKKSYPFHRVCGEYISNEAVPFLKSLDLYPEKFVPPSISRFQLSSVNGRSATVALDLGGFGISRYSFDHFIYERAKNLGVEFYLNTEVEDILFSEEKFEVKANQKNFQADIVIGAFGKRSKMDVQLERNFIRKRSPYLGVKYHIRTDNPNDLISLHNFQGGYCGMSSIEDGKTTLCYLAHRDCLKRYGKIKDMEEGLLYRNPLLKSVFINSDFIFDKPETINEISFETKGPVENHILMAGDAAGMITPLCGNGMAMAIHAAKILSELLIRFCKDNNFSRENMELNYARQWNTHFARRLWAGRQIQRLFGNELASSVALNLAIYSKPVTHAIIRNTHGKAF